MMLVLQLRTRRALLSCASFLLLVGALAGQSLPQKLEPPRKGVTKPQFTSPYHELDNVEGDWVNLMNPPYRPMVLSQDQTRLWAVDNHSHEVHEVDGATGAVLDTYGVPAGPVAIARWLDPDEGNAERLVVVCRTSWVLCLLDPAAGSIVGLVRMEQPAKRRQLGEPSDVVIVDDLAYVTCAASDAVAEVDLRTEAITRVFDLPGKHPTFLSLHASGDVLVVPQLSGNNTAPHRATDSVFETGFRVAVGGELGVLNLDDPSIAVKGLDDHDVYRIHRSGPLAGTLTPVAKGVGTVLFAHGIHPTTGDLWVLNTEANNKNPAQQDETTLAGDFADNRLSVLTLAAGSTVAPHTIVNFDVVGTGPMGEELFDPARSVGQPFALAFHPSGAAFVAGMLTDTVTLLTSTGGFTDQVQLPDGSIPRGLVYSAPLNTIFAYCWGTNRIERIPYVASPVLQSPVDLGFDPTPPELQAGREILFDAANSANNRFACVTCHVDGESDMALWPIADPKDDKGPLLTQSMTGLDVGFPFHWRAEQRGQGDQVLVDFNETFVDLMGGPAMLDTTPGAEWDQLEAFVLSLQNPANPNQNLTRRLDDRTQPRRLPGGLPSHASRGQFDFLRECANCHSFPKGASGDVVADLAAQGERNPHRQYFKPQKLAGLFRREQDADPSTAVTDFVTVDFNDAHPLLPDEAPYPVLGMSISHLGSFASLFQRVKFFALGPSVTADITGMLHQWDEGIAPVCHRAWYIDDATPQAVYDEITRQLIAQCRRPYTTLRGQTMLNADFAVIGTFWNGASLVPMRWYYDPALNRLIPEDSSQSPVLPTLLFEQAQNGLSTNTFIGMPLGTARRFAVDYDNDGLFNADELSLPGGATDPVNPDSDGDGWLDGYEVEHGSDPRVLASVPVDLTPPDFVGSGVELRWVTIRTAVLRFETTEPTLAQVTLASNTGDARVVQTPRLTTRHRIVVTDLHGSGLAPTNYTATVQIFDPSNNPATTPQVVNFTTETLLGANTLVRANELAFTSLPAGPNDAMTVRVQAVDRRVDGPPLPRSGYRAIARVQLDGQFLANDADLETFGVPKSFEVGSTPYTTLAGPFVISAGVTDASGYVDLTFSLPNAVAGQELTIVLEALQVPKPTPPNVVEFTSIGMLSLSDTPPAMRVLELVL